MAAASAGAVPPARAETGWAGKLLQSGESCDSAVTSAVGFALTRGALNGAAAGWDGESPSSCAACSWSPEGECHDLGDSSVGVPAPPLAFLLACGSLLAASLPDTASEKGSRTGR